MRILYFLLSLILIINAVAQSGPGGYGSTDGTSNLVLWLRADAGVLNAGATSAINGETVATWQDQSGNGYHAVGVNSPVFTETNANFNNWPTITFVEADDDYLRVEDDANEAPELDNTSELSVFFVFRSNNSTGTRGLLSKRDGNNSAQSYVFYESGNINSRVNANNDAGVAIAANTTYINSLTYQSGDFGHWLNQVSGGGITGGTASIPNNNSDLNIGEFHAGDGRTFGGNFAEIIIFRQYLTNAQRIVVESYLASKYGITVANDFWNQTTYTTYNNQIAGIGQHTDGSVANSATSAVLSISGGSDRGNGEWLFWGHNNGDFTTYTSTEIVTGSSQLRLAREWVVNETGELGNVTVSIPAASLPATGLAVPNFYLLVDTDGNANFNNATSYPMTLNGANYEVTLDLDEGHHLAIAFEAPVPAGVSGTLAFWFEASTGVENGGSPATNGQNVTLWQDLSANNADATNGAAPQYSETNAVNFRPVVNFESVSSEYLEFDLTDLEGADYTLMAVVQRNSGTGSQYLLGSQNNAADALLFGYSSNTQLDGRNSSTATVNTAVGAFNSPDVGPALIALNYNSTNLSLNQFKNGTNNTASTATSTDYAATGYLGNLGRALGANYFNGYVSEVIGFSSNLSTADYNALATNLAIKYGVNLGMDYVDEQANLLWDLSDNGVYTNGVAVIGYDDSFQLDQRISSASNDELLIATDADFTSLNTSGSRTSLGDGQYAFISNDGSPIALTETYNSVANSRVNRVWRIREVGAPGVLNIAIPTSVVEVNVMLVSTDPTFSSGVTEVSLSTAGSFVYATRNFNDGEYFTFVSDPSEVWYSYVSGNWNDPLSWTLDGAISALYVNPNGKVPTAGDSVVIKSGRNIFMNVDNVDITKLEIYGTLDLAATSGHNFNYLEGNGTLRLSGTAGFDNYPMANDTLFYEALEGGTVEYYGNGLTINSDRQYNNLIINLTNSTDVFLQLADIGVNGDFTVERGTYQMNNGSAITNLTIDILGDVQVTSSGNIRVGTANARHEFNLYGDFSNEGLSYFTNRTSQTTGSEATNGIIDFNLLSGSQDQLVELSNVTRFYRIEINKGVDATYIADIQSTSAGNFELYGYAAQGHGAVAQLTDNNNALGLIMGTVKLGVNVDIGALNTGGNYNISEGAQLWLDGGTAFKNGGTAIVPYGSIRVTAGTLTANVDSGITSRANGTLFMDGGTVTIRQFRTSVFGATNQGGIVMTGGTLNITGELSGGINDNYYPLNLTYSGNAFTVSGGTINISGANSKGGVFINSDPENISVTGGSFNFISNTTNPFLITSRAGFYNLTMTKTSASGGQFRVGTGQSGPGGDDETVPNLPLEIINDITVDNTAGNNISFDPQGNDIAITGSLNITAGSTADFTDMRIIFEKSGSSSLNIGLASALELDSLIINKNNQYVSVNISNGPATALQVNRYLGVLNGNFNNANLDVNVLGNIEVMDTVGISAGTGRVLMQGSSAQTITSASGGAIYRLTINNSNGVTQTGAFNVPGDLALNSGILGISTHQLTLSAPPTTTGTFSNTLMIRTAGNASDGGVRLYFDGLTADPVPIFIPLGTNANAVTRYTPTTLDLSGIADNGYVSVRMSDTQLQTVNLAALANNMLTYYWRVRHTGFSTLPTVQSIVFRAVDSDDPDGGATPAGFNANFVPGKVLDELPFTRSQENTSDISGFNITFNGTGSGFTLENANYTAGNGSTALFTGAPEIYYSRVSDGNWVNFSSNSSWSRISHQGASATDYPKVGDVAIIGSTYIGGGTGRHQIQGVTGAAGDITIAALIFNSQAGGSALNVTDMSRLRIRGNRTLNVGTVTGTGEIVQDIGNASQMATIVGDLGEFLAEDNNGWFFWFQSAVDVTITDRFTYPIFRLFGNTGTLTFSQDVTAHGVVIDSGTELRITNNFTIDSLVQVGSNGSGTLAFRNVGASRTFETGSIYFSNDASNNVTVQNAGSDIHRMIVNGDINLTSGTGFNLRSAAGSQVVLELSGAGNHSFVNTTGVYPQLYRLEMNKGSDTTSVFTFHDNFVLNGPVNVEPPALEIIQGKLVLNDPAINVVLGNGIDIEIPSGAGLEVTQGTVTSANSILILDGLLRINGGTVTLSNTDIEYSNSGKALINVQSGSFEVGNILRRAITTSTGRLKYRQTGGTVLIASNNAPSYTPSRAAFEVTNTNSEFTFTGGSFTIQRGVTGDNNISLLLEPETYNITGSTIQLGNANTPAYTANYFNLKTAIPLHNLIIFDDADNRFPPVRLVSRPLIVNGTLTITSNSGLIANGFDVTLNGDLANSGLFRNLSANTILNAPVAQNITGVGTFELYNLTKQNTGTATTNQNLSLSHDLSVLGGILNLQSNSISLENDAYIESTVQTTGGNGIIFDGVANQDLYGVPNVAISIGTITTQNAAGIDIPDGNGYQFNITKNLRLNGGVFNIGGALVRITRGGVLTEASPFNINNMIQTNNSFTDNGFIQEFHGVNADTTIFFPIGELKYTPIQFNLNAGTTQGDIRVRPANERHPTIIENTEPITEAEIADFDNVLKYYWGVVARDLTNTNGEIIFSYLHDDIEVTVPYDTSNYISARLLSNGVNWDKYDPALFWGGTQTFRIPLNSATSAEITGDYTAGVGSSDGLNNDIEGAIPDEIAQYLSDFGGLGNYNNDPNWNPQGSSPVLSSGIGPVGAAVTIRSGDDVTLNLSNIRLYSTHLESGSVLRVPAGSLGNRLGTVTGTGTIVLTDTELLPTGEYSDFLACDGGILQYSGNSSYNVLSGISQIRKVIFDGSGTRLMPNNALNVCDTLVVNGPTISLNTGQTYNIGDADTDRLQLQSGTINIANATTLNVHGDLILEGGTLNGNTGNVIEVTDDITFTGGTLNWNNLRVILDGTTEQVITGNFTGANAIDRLWINNTSTAGVTVASGQLQIDVLLRLLDGSVNTSSSALLVINSTGNVTDASVNSYVTGPMRKISVPSSSTYTFPVGKAMRYAPVSVANVGTGGDTWTAEYFTSTNPTYPNASFDPIDPGSGKNALIRVQSTDRWEVTSAGSNSAQIRITYGPHNNFENEESVRVVWWDGAGDMRWENMGAIVTGTPASGTVISEDVISFSTQQFALGYAPETLVPVDLIDFNAQYRNGAVRIVWHTASEKNNDYFEVQRSLDGKTFETISVIDGAGDSNELLTYSTIDTSPYLGVSYYRLHQVDFDGVYETFPAVVVYNDLVQKGLDFRMIPNPTTAEAINFVLTTGDDHTPVFIRMTDVSGRIVLDTAITPVELKLGESLHPTMHLNPGVYFISAIQGEDVRIQKLIIQE
jgi:hypothetical protein